MYVRALIIVFVTSTVCLSENWVKSMCCCQIQHNFRCSEHLCKLGKEYFLFTDMQVLYFFLDKI